MSNSVISVENLSKSYRLGQINTGTFSRDLEAWWARLRGRPNPHLRIGETDHGNRDGEELWALRDVSFTVEQGEVLGIIGRNGAGKSTLLKILSRVTAPTSGRIRVKGRVASLLEVGTGFHPELTGRENVYLNGAILGMTRQEVTRKFDEIVDFAGVEKFIDTPVKRYSSGMYVRLAFAVAAHLDPEILVVDEVLAVGDAEFQKKCLGKMGEVAQGGRTVLFVSHNMAAVSSLCPVSLLLNRGELQVISKSELVIDEYLNFRELDEQDFSNDPVQISNFSILNTNRETIKSDEPLLFVFDVRCERGFWNMIFHITIRNTDNQVILQDRQLFDNKIQSLSNKNYRVQIDIPPLNLKSGLYSVIVKIVTDDMGGRKRFVSSPNVFSLTSDKPTIDFDNPGILSPKVTWMFSDANDSISEFERSDG